MLLYVFYATVKIGKLLHLLPVNDGIIKIINENLACPKQDG